MHGGMTAVVRNFLFLLFLAGVCSCSNRALEPGIEKVVPYYLREIRPPDNSTPMVRSEALKRLHGAVAPSEMADRLGHYYTVTWSVEDISQPVELVLLYQQTTTASKQHRLVQRIEPTSSGSQVNEFAIIGPEFRERGPVLAWKVELRQGGQVVDSEQSFLWQ